MMIVETVLNGAKTAVHLAFRNIRGLSGSRFYTSPNPSCEIVNACNELSTPKFSTVIAVISAGSDFCVCGVGQGQTDEPGNGLHNQFGRAGIY